MKKVISTAQGAATSGVQVELGGSPISAAATAAPGPSEGFGITAALLIMLLAFGSVVAMGLPVITALAGLGIGIALLELLTHLFVVPNFSPEMAAMIGIGVGIDYALFIVTRYRQGIFEGRTPREAVMTAHMTAGRSVLFAGSTVVISLFGLYLIGQPYMIGLATGCIAAVLMVLVAALTLLPAMLGFAGGAIDKLHVPGLLQSGGPPPENGFWHRWSRFVQRRAWFTGTAAVLILVALAIPLFSMRLEFTDAGNDPTNLTTRQAYDLLAQGFGPGFNGPLVVAVAMNGASDVPTVQHLDRALSSGVPGVAFTAPAQFNADDTGAVITVVPTTSPQADQTVNLVTQLRSNVIPPVVHGTDVVAQVGGETAASIDAANFLGHRLFLVIGAVLILSFLLLMVVFRSLVLPLKAVIMNLLSVGALFGVSVGGGVPVGLGRQHHRHRREGTHRPVDPRHDVRHPVRPLHGLRGLPPLAHPGRVVAHGRELDRRGRRGLGRHGAHHHGGGRASCSAVFGSFIINDPLHILKVFGLGLAVAVLIDATLVRMVLVPSIMELPSARSTGGCPVGWTARCPSSGSR